MPVDPAKIAALKKQAPNKVGGIRRKVNPVVDAEVIQEDKKLKAALSRFAVRDIGFESAQIFQGENVLDFNKCKVQMIAGANCYLVSGKPQVKSTTEYLTSQFRQILTPETLNMFRNARAGAAGAGEGAGDLPEFPGTFE